ncbi:type 2 lantibiotic biosynthesis protein LanM [Lachnospiraceae bacterium KH1T2]|nr:type 2 lantibiotic biosynthesis protein LanM [Lachnospiraceae bacterium KH1T2]
MVENEFDIETVDMTGTLANSLGDEGVFDEFYIPYLILLEEKMYKLEREIHFFICEDVRKNILLYAKSSLMEYSCRILIHELNTEDQEYEDFCKRISRYPEKIFDKYPVLKTKIDNKLISIEKNIKELFVRLKHDRENIKEVFGIDVKNLSEIELGQGDTHNQGKTVAVLSFKDKKLVYKPRSMEPERIFSRCSRWVDSHLGDYYITNPKLVLGEDYGFQQYMESRECNSEDEVKRYYHRIGRAMGLFYIFDTSDIHGENIIPHGEYPIFVDLETLFVAPRKIDKENDLAQYINDRINHSVFMSNLLPNAFSGSVLDVDISGLGARAGQKSERFKNLQLLDKGKKSIHFEEVYYVTDEMNNVVKLNGKPVDYIKYVEEIEKGFSETCDILVKNKDKVINYIIDDCSKVRCRQILRGTFVYVRFLMASLHPKYCNSADKVKKLLNIINSQNDKQGKSEIEQMLEHDVPYFYTGFDDKALYHDNKVVEEDFFGETIRERIVEKLRKLDAEEIERQLIFIRNSIMLAKDDVFSETSDYSDSICKGREDSDVLKEITDVIRKYAVWNKSGDACTFIDINVGSERSSMGSIAYSLYDGIGLILFLFAYAKYTQKDEDEKLASAALKGMEEIAPMEEAALSSSVFCGFSGYIYLYYNLYKMTKYKDYYVKYQAALNRISEYDCSSEKKYDVIAGVSGAIIALANIYEYEKDDRIKVIIEKYAAHLEKALVSGFISLTGFSHGYAGVELAFMKALSITGNQRYLEISKKIETKEDSYFVKSRNNWLDLRKEEAYCSFWCHGAPGILLGRSYYMDKIEFKKKYKPVIEEIIRKLSFDVPHVFNDSMCHGRVGNLDILSTIAGNVMDKKLQLAVDKYMLKEEDKIRRYGIGYGIPQLKGVVSYMLGLSGIGYGLLRSKTKEIPSILGLEVV